MLYFCAPCAHRIGLNDIAEEGTFVWSDDEPLGYTNWFSGDQAVTGAGCADGDGSCGDGVGMCGESIPDPCAKHWADAFTTGRHPYICARKSTPTAATGGEMLGCAGGRWVLGAPYKQPTSTRRRLPPTIVRA